jgi:DNA-binding transcriptional LysR family regulator
VTYGEQSSKTAEPSGDFRFGLPRSFGDIALARAIQSLHPEFPKLKLHAFVQWSQVLLERLAERKLDAAVVHLPDSSVPPASLAGGRIGTKVINVVAAKAARFSHQVTLKELSASPWVLNPCGCPSRQLLETALLQRGLPFETAAEAEGYDLQFSLIADGVGSGIAPPDVFHASPRHKNLKIVRVKDFLRN